MASFRLMIDATLAAVHREELPGSSACGDRTILHPGRGRTVHVYASYLNFVSGPVDYVRDKRNCDVRRGVRALQPGRSQRARIDLVLNLNIREVRIERSGPGHFDLAAADASASNADGSRIAQQDDACRSRDTRQVAASPGGSPLGEL